MSIIIYHQEESPIDPEVIDALRSFYKCEHVVEDWNLLEQVPDSTLVICKLDDGPVIHHEQNTDIRIIHINTAVPEMISHFINTSPVPGQHYYETELRKFLEHQRGEIFTIDDVIMFFGWNRDSDGTFYEIQSLVRILERMGCGKEHITVFTPPPMQPPAQQHAQNRNVERNEIVA